jgi:hypothetical protein
VATEPEVKEGTPLLLMAFATVCGVVGIFTARYFYKDGPEKVRGVVAGIAPLHKLVVNKFYVDELYDLILIRPFRWLATAVYNVFDRLVIDLILVDGSAFVADMFGRLLRFVQNGDVQRYFGAIVFGVFGLLVWTTWWTEGKDIGFSYSGDAGAMHFKADVGKGPSAKNAVINWDFNGDGQKDSTSADPTWTFDKPGKQHVTLWVQNLVDGKVKRLDRDIDVVAASSEPAPDTAPPAPAGGGGQ